MPKAAAVSGSYDPDTKTVEITEAGKRLAELQLVSNTDHCLIDCEAVIRIRPGTQMNLPLAADADYRWDFVNTSPEQAGLESYWFEIQRTVPVTVKDYSNACNPYYISYENGTAGTVSNCTRTEASRTEYLTMYEPFDFWGEKLEAGKDYYVRIRGRKYASLGDNSLDWVMTFRGVRISEWATWLSGWDRRILVNLSQAREYEIIQVNFSGLQTSGCSATNCSDIRVTEGADREIPYQVIVNQSTRGRAVSKFGDKAGSIWVLFRIINASQKEYYIYYHNSSAADASQFLLAWEDDFESYSNGSIPTGFNSGVLPECGGNVPVVTVLDDGTKGYGNNGNVACGRFDGWTNSTDMTLWTGANRTVSNDQMNFRARLSSVNTNADGYMALLIFGNSNRIRRIVDGYDINVSTPFYSRSVDANMTLVLNSSTIRLYLDNTLNLTGNDTADTSGDKIGLITGIAGHNTYWTFFKWYNTTIIPYNDNTIAFGGEESQELSGEESGRNATVDGIVAALGSSMPIYTDQLVYVKNQSVDKYGRFDKVASYGNQRWAFNYVTGTESYASLGNMTPSLYTLELMNLPYNDIRSRVETFINSTKVS